MAKSNEPIWWSLFSAGGVVAAFLIPITMFLTGIAVPAGWISVDGLYSLVHHPVSRLYLFLIISLPLFHGAHRLLFTLVHLGLHGMRKALPVILYGTAMVGTLLAALLLIRL
jgi:fumarate reductase subunit D